MLRVLIADDSPAVLDGLSSILSLEPDFEVAGVARDGLEAVDKASQLRPDVVIMDAQMPNMDGAEATRQIKQGVPGAGVLLFTVFTHWVEAGLAAGADSHLAKDCAPEELLAELRRVAAMQPGRG